MLPASALKPLSLKVSVSVGLPSGVSTVGWEEEEEREGEGLLRARTNTVN